MVIYDYAKKNVVQKQAAEPIRELKKYSVLLLCALLFFALCGCSRQGEIRITQGNGTTCANIVMAMGRFAYRDGLLYFADPENIYEYDIETGKTIFLPVNPPGDPMDLMVSDDHIIYCGYSENYENCAVAVTKDGKKTTELFKGKEGCYQLYIEEFDAYYLSARGGDLYYRNMADGKEKLILKDALTYFVTAEELYAIQFINEKYVLKICARDNYNFETIPLSFEPIEILVNGENIFLSRKGDYQVVCYCNGSETTLPIRSLKFQVDGDYLFYSDEDTFQNSTWTIKCFGLETQNTTVICEDVMEFGIFEEGYIAFWCRGDTTSWWKLYDKKTNELQQIYPAA